MTFPRYVFKNGVNPLAPDSLATLREIAPNLYVGDFTSLAHAPVGSWHRIVDLYGSSASAERVLSLSLNDGDAFPEGHLERIRVYLNGQAGLRGNPCLIHCQAGLSRSASAAAALLILAGLAEEEAIRRVRVHEMGKGYPRKQTLQSALAWARQARERGVRFLLSAT